MLAIYYDTVQPKFFKEYTFVAFMDFEVPTETLYSKNVCSYSWMVAYPQNFNPKKLLFLWRFGMP